MENWLSVIFTAAALLNFCLTAFLLLKVRNISNQILANTQKIDTVATDINRSIADLREPLETAKPIKTTNWDSIREAFKGPARRNERN